MVDSLHEFNRNTIPPYMRTTKFKHYIESVMTILKDPQTIKSDPVIPSEGFANRSDLTGYLIDKGIAARYHYTVMRMNDMTSTMDFNETYKLLVYPDPNVFAELIGYYEGSLL